MESVDEPTSKRKIIIGILILFFGIIISLLISKALTSYGLSLTVRFTISRILIWIVVLLMIWYAIKIERTKFLIWQDTKRNLVFYIIAIIAIFVIMVFGSFLIGETLKLLHFNNKSKIDLKLIHLLKENHWLIYVAAVTAGVTEELLFRGYLLPRLQILLRSNTWAILISSLLFGLMHFGWGTVYQIIGPFYFGCIFAVFYQKYQNIKVLIICHTLFDLINFIGVAYSHH